MSELNCIVIEDEPLATKIVTDYIGLTPFLQLQACFKDAIDALEWLRTGTTDLIFLDIHLPRLKGMAFLKSLPQPPAVIVTTAYDKYAVEGFELNVTDYLLKPFSFERFLIAVSKVKTARAAQTPSRDHIFLTVQKKKIKILFSDIIYIESQREYIKIITLTTTHLSKLGTHDIEAMLPVHLFRRIHRSFIISIAKINAYTADTVEVNGIALPVGRGYKDIIEGL